MTEAAPQTTEGQEAPKYQLRDWVKNNAPMATVTGVMIAAAVFSRSLGTGHAALWLSSCFIFMALLLILETFSTFPPYPTCSGHSQAFMLVLGSAFGNLTMYWMLLVYRVSGTAMLGVVSALLGYTVGEWLIKTIPAFRQKDRQPWKVLRPITVLACGMALAFAANRTIPIIAPTIERDFGIQVAASAIGPHGGSRAPVDTVIQEGKGQKPQEAGVGLDSMVVAETLNVAVTKAPPHDLFDWVQFVVSSLLVITAAWVGALVGGKQARKGSLEAIQKEYELERSHAVQRLRQRLESNFERAQQLRARVIDHDRNEPFDVAVGEELEVLWNNYYRVSEPIFSLGSRDFAERVDSFFVTAHNLAETVKALENHARALVLSTVDGHSPLANDARANLPNQRDDAITAIVDLLDGADALLATLRATKG